ncbi:hypothetical protein [Ramlibacter sp.]|uniref:hypothetical protein n=1 Tax=Ramlibacter sp. TaxID=1917967 RepID=UPI0017BCAF78|nr:hypothetical protein [Ramlibacter sp.]MBA2675932.1 hypothetical protein [Ramlibacter sp.]
MRRFSKLLIALAAVLGAAAAPAQTLVSTSTYADLLWSFSTTQNGFTGCSQLQLDATGAISRSDNYAMYGQLSCPSLGGTYGVDGSAYFNAAGNFNMTLDFGVAYKLVCNNLNGGTLSGSCIIYNGSGTQTGTAFISFL